MAKFAVTALFLILIWTGCKAQLQQERFSLSAGSGGMYYLGDLTVDKLPQKKQLYPYFYLSARQHLSPVFSIDLAFMRGKVGAADSLTSRKALRNFHFRSPISDFHLLLGIDMRTFIRNMWKKDGIKKRFDHMEVLDGPRIMIGAGYFHFNPEASHEGKWWHLQPLGTEGQNIGGDYPDPYRLWQFNLKLGGEIGFRVSRHLRFDLYGAYSFLFTDYLDDVSGDFPDYNELLEAPRGELASEFTYRLRSNPNPVKGAQRGNPEIRDAYLNLGVKVTYIFSRAQLDQMKQ